jgi:hypothetical protein
MVEVHVTSDAFITSYDMLPVQVVRNIGDRLAAIDSVESRYDFLYRAMPENIKRQFLDVYHKSAEWIYALSFRELLNVLYRLKWSRNDGRQYTSWPIDLSRDSKALTQSLLHKGLEL